MAIAWLNKPQLEVRDLYLIHGLLCQERSGHICYVDAPATVNWFAGVKLEWGVPVVVITKQTHKRNWRGNYICERSYITLDTLANRIDDLSKTFWKNSASDYERLLGLDIQSKLKLFKEAATAFFWWSWTSRLLNRIRSCCCFCSIRRNSIKSMESNFRRYGHPSQPEQWALAYPESINERAHSSLGRVLHNKVLLNFD